MPEGAKIIPAHSPESAFSVAMLRALNDLRRGPAFSLPGALYQGEQPARMWIRRRTVHSLKERGFVTVERLEGFIDRCTITETGRSFLVNHPAVRELQVA